MSDKQPTHPHYWYLFWLVPFLAVLYFCLTPPPNMPLTEPGLDKIQHFAAFCGLTLWYLPPQAARTYFGRVPVLLLIGGILIEFVQPMVGRSFDVMDMLADSGGIVLGTLLHRHTRLPAFLHLLKRRLGHR